MWLSLEKANYEAHVELILFCKIISVCVHGPKDTCRSMAINMWTLVSLDSIPLLNIAHSFGHK